VDRRSEKGKKRGGKKLESADYSMDLPWKVTEKRTKGERRYRIVSVKKNKFQGASRPARGGVGDSHGENLC